MTSLSKNEKQLNSGAAIEIWQTLLTRMGKEKLAYILMLFGSTFLAGGFIFANQHQFHPYETGLVRGIACVAVCYILARYNQIDIEFRSPHNIRWLLLRNFFLVLQGLTYSAVQYYLPLPIAVTINSCSPLFVYIYDYLFYGVKINCKQLFGVSISFLGVLLVANGPYLKSLMNSDFQQQTTTFANYKTKDPILMIKAGVVTLVGAALQAVGTVMTKKLVQVDALQINYNLGILMLISSAILLPWGAQNYSQRPQIYFWGVLWTGVPLALGQLAYIGALILTRNLGVITTISFASIIFGYGVSIIRYGESINLLCCIGAIAIMVGITTIVIYKEKSPPESEEK